MATTGQIRAATITVITTAIDISLGQVFTLTTSGAATLTISNPANGAVVYLIVTGGGSHVITFGTNIKGLGTLTVTVGQIFTLEFVCDGTSLLEVARTAVFTDTS